MKRLILISTAVVGLGLSHAFAQLGPQGGGQGPNFDAATDKLFGDNQSFSAIMEFQTSMGGNEIIMPGKLSFDNGKSRFEVNMSELRGANLPPNVAEQMKAMGMDTVVTISRPDVKLAYLVYPGLSSYTEMTSLDSTGSGTNDWKMEAAELGKETVDGHDCIKNKTTVTDKEGNKHESTVWNATDLKNFPVKIVTGESGRSATMLFKNVSFDKPAATAFNAPSGYTKYDDAQTMVQTEMMKHMGGALGVPPH